MTKLKLLSSVALVLAIIAGGVAAWHFTRPTTADKLTSKADSVLKTFKPLPQNTDKPRYTSGSIASSPVEKKHAVSTQYAVIRIPAVGLKFPIVEGTDEHRDLSKGVGHYTNTAQVGQLGNYALAGHVCCESNGQPFKFLYRLHANDVVLIDTAEAIYTYRVLDNTACGYSQQIVHMSKIEVINPVPCSTATPTRRLMTLTTCKITQRGVPSIMRRIVWAELVEVEAR